MQHQAWVTELVVGFQVKSEEDHVQVHRSYGFEGAFPECSHIREELCSRLAFQEEAVSSNIWSKTLPRSFVAKSFDKEGFHLTNAESITKH